MQKRIIIYVAAILLVLRSGYAYQQPRDSRAILTETPALSDARIAYGKDPNQFGELRLPHGTAFKKPYPVVVMLHGGCWMAEYGLGYMGHVGADLAAQGIATWNLEYRRVGNPGGGIVGTFHDVQLGVGHLETLAKNYPLDLQRIVVIGRSAGGHLALRLADVAGVVNPPKNGDEPRAENRHTAHHGQPSKAVTACRIKRILLIRQEKSSLGKRRVRRVSISYARFPRNPRNTRVPNPADS